jgi:hypothetical protein
VNPMRHDTKHSEARRLARRARNLRTLQLATPHSDLAAQLELQASIAERKALALMGYK